MINHHELHLEPHKKNIRTNNYLTPGTYSLISKTKRKSCTIFAARGGREAMFRDCKSGGYNREGSQANAQHLTNLILVIAIAYTASCLVGLKIRNIGHQEELNRLKLEGKNCPRHSYFLRA